MKLLVERTESGWSLEQVLLITSFKYLTLFQRQYLLENSSLGLSEVETAEPAQNGPTLFLTRYRVAFQRQQTNTANRATKRVQRREFDLQLPGESKWPPPRQDQSTRA